MTDEILEKAQDLKDRIEYLRTIRRKFNRLEHHRKIEFFNNITDDMSDVVITDEALVKNILNSVTSNIDFELKNLEEKFKKL